MRTRWRMALGVLLVLGGVAGGWMAWERWRPASEERWHAARKAGRTAEAAQRYGRAAACYRIALREAEKFGTQDLRVAESCLAMSHLYTAWAAAADRLDPGAPGAYLWFTATTRPRALPAAWSRLGEARQARRLARDRDARLAPLMRAHAIHTRHFRPDDPTYADACETVAAAYTAAGDRVRARACLEQALAIRTRADGPQALTLLPTLRALEACLRNQRDLTHAATITTRILATHFTHAGLADAEALTLLDERLVLLLQGGQSAQVERWLHQMLAAAERAHGTSDIRLVVPLRRLARCYRLQKRYNHAAPLYQRGIAIGTRHFHLPYARMSDPLLYPRPFGPEMLHLLDDYAHYLNATGQRSTDLWMRLTD